MKTIKEINKLFDEECPTHVSLGKGSFVILRSEAENIRIKEFWNKQILSLIEELEGKMPKKVNADGDPEKETYNAFIDQIKNKLEELKVK